MRIIIVMSDIALMNMRYFLSPPLYFLPKKAFYSVFSDIPPLLYHFPRHTSRFFFIPALPQRKSGGKSPSLFHKDIFALISAVYLLAFVIFLNIQVDF